MKAFSQSGHTLSTTMIIVTVLALISLTALRNGLMDFKIAQAFDKQQLFSERHSSALHFLEATIIPQIMDTESTLYQTLNLMEDNSGMEIAIPLRALLGIENAADSEEYLDPTVTVYLQPATEAMQPTRLRFEIKDNNTGHILTAVYQHDPDADPAAVFDPDRIRRLSLYKSAS